MTYEYGFQKSKHATLSLMVAFATKAGIITFRLFSLKCVKLQAVTLLLEIVYIIVFLVKYSCNMIIM